MTICDYCCEYLDIKMIEGVHRPYVYHYEIDSSENEIYDIEHRTKNLNIDIRRKQTIKVDEVSNKFLIFII